MRSLRIDKSKRIRTNQLEAKDRHPFQLARVTVFLIQPRAADKIGPIEKSLNSEQ